MSRRMLYIEYHVSWTSTLTIHPRAMSIEELMHAIAGFCDVGAQDTVLSETPTVRSIEEDD